MENCHKSTLKDRMIRCYFNVIENVGWAFLLPQSQQDQTSQLLSCNQQFPNLCRWQQFCQCRHEIVHKITEVAISLPSRSFLFEQQSTLQKSLHFQKLIILKCLKELYSIKNEASLPTKYFICLIYLPFIVQALIQCTHSCLPVANGFLSHSSWAQISFWFL